MLFTPNLFFFRKDGIRQSLTTSSFGGQKICLIPRDQCSFRRIRISGKRAKYLKAAEFRVRQESGLGENRFIIIPDADGKRASVWSFKSDRRHKGRYIPESLALSKYDEGVRLVSLSKGFEGQVWSGGQIVSSRWWVKKPDHRKWSSFLYSSQDEYDVGFESMPSAQTLPYRTDFPLFHMDKERVASLFSPANLSRVIALGLSCIFLFISGQYLRNQLSLKQVENHIFDLSPVTAQISSERRRAMANLRKAMKYNIVGHSGTFILGLNDIVSAMDGKGLVIERINLSSSDLEIRFQSSEDIDVPKVVAALEASQSLTNVSIALSNQDHVILIAELVEPYDYQDLPAKFGGQK